MRVVQAAEITALQAELSAAHERNRRLEAQLRNLADHDPVTDLLNRRSMEHELEQHIARCSRYGPEGALALVALDGLDGVASAWGQAAADEVLATLAERVVSRLRDTDVVARWSGGELAVLLPRASVDEVEAVAGAVAALVGEAGTPRVPPGSLTAAIGVALVITDPVLAVDRAAGAVLAARRRGGGWAVAS